MALECGFLGIGLVTGFVVLALYVVDLECGSMALWLCGSEQWALGGLMA